MISTARLATCTIVVSRGQSRNPEKRAIEQQLIDAATAFDGVDVLVVPHLYDLPRSGETYERLAAVEGDMIVASWIYPRAAHWVLDRNGIQGQVGDVLLVDPNAPDEDDEETGDFHDAESFFNLPAGGDDGDEDDEEDNKRRS